MTGLLSSASGHFGELLQGRLGPDGPLVLTTLPCARFQSQVQWLPSRALSLRGVGPQSVRPDQLRQLARALDVSARGVFTLQSNMPLGGGAGASTAALTAVSRMLKPEAAGQEIAQACLQVEGATDPLMFDRSGQLLWASRRAQIIDCLPPLPRMVIAGGFYGTPQRTCPEDQNFPDVGDLVEPLTQACQTNDLTRLAHVASESAQRCLALRGPMNDPTANLMERTGALGMVIAHTGSARGLIFAPGTLPADIRPVMLKAGLRGLVTFSAGGNT